MAKDFDDDDDFRPKRSKRERDERNDDSDDDFQAKRSKRNDDSDDDFDRRPMKPQPKKGKGLKIALFILIPLAFCCALGGVGGYFGIVKVRDAGQRMFYSNNYREVGIAMENYENTHGYLPSNSKSITGKPLLSWRVHLLPYLGEDSLYNKFNKNEPWDSPTNIKLLDQMPAVYGNVAQPKGQAKVPVGNKTHMRGLVGPGTLFEREMITVDGISAINSKDLLSQGKITGPRGGKIFCFEAGDAVEWTKPDDVPYVPGAMPKVGGAFPGYDKFLVVHGDGTIYWYNESMNATSFQMGAQLNDPRMLPQN